MNLEKLQPWNWSKHEEGSINQVPITKDHTSGKPQQPGSSSLVSAQGANSLMQLHREMDRLFDDVWRSFRLWSSLILSRGTFLPRDNFAKNIMAAMGNGVLTINIPRKTIATENVKQISISS